MLWTVGIIGFLLLGDALRRLEVFSALDALLTS